MLFLLFPPSGITFVGEDKSTSILTLILLLCTFPSFLPSPSFCSPLPLSFSPSLCFPLLVNSGLGEIFHSSFDRCQLGNTSPFKLTYLGETKFVQANSNWGDKVPGHTRWHHWRHPYQAPRSQCRWPICLFPVLTCSWLTQMKPWNTVRFFLEVVKKKRVDSDSA